MLRDRADSGRTGNWRTRKTNIRYTAFPIVPRLIAKMKRKYVPGRILFLCEGGTRNVDPCMPQLLSVVANCDLGNISKGNTNTIINWYSFLGEILPWCYNRTKLW